MSFMIAFIPLSLPVALVIDTYGFRLSVSIGAALMGIFVFIMEAMRTVDGSFTPSLLLAIALLVVSLLLVTQMKDPKLEGGETP